MCLFVLNFVVSRSLESNLFNKANELQEEISLKRLDIRMAQLHLASCRAQVQLYIYMCM